MPNYNSFSQIYRYVKGWYRKYDGTEYAKWIKKFIVYDYTGIYPESISDQEYFGLLRQAVIEHFNLYPENGVEQVLHTISDSAVMLQLQWSQENNKCQFYTYPADFHDQVMERAFSNILNLTTKDEIGDLAPILNVEKIYDEMQKQIANT